MKYKLVSFITSITGVIHPQSSHAQLDFLRNLEINSDCYEIIKDLGNVSVKKGSFGSLSANPDTSWMNLRLERHAHCYGCDCVDISHNIQSKPSFPLKPRARSHRDLSTGGNYGH